MIGRPAMYKGKKLKIAMAWWGSWGHVFPIKSLLEWIYKKPQYVQRIDKIYWFGTQNSLESQICEELNVLEWNIEWIKCLQKIDPYKIEA